MHEQPELLMYEGDEVLYNDDLEEEALLAEIHIDLQYELLTEMS